MADEIAEKRERGRGRGSNFFALGRDVWDRLWEAKTTNRFNLILTYLVLLAGTGSDHRLTKWSAKACEQHLGLGKPRAKHAIEELIAARLVSLTDSATRLSPQYELPPLPADDDPIFLPVQLVTGLAGETPMLRRVKETGDVLLLRMLIDLYGMITLDAPHGIPITNLRAGGFDGGRTTAKKISSTGVHAVWAIEAGTYTSGGGEWTAHHMVQAKKASEDVWALFWQRIGVLKQIGCLYYEPWLFDSAALDAEPLMPLDPSFAYAVAEPDDEARLTRLAFDAAQALVGEERGYLFDRHGNADFFIPLPLHHQEPAVRHVARLKVEADTPGRRLAWRRRRILIEQWGQAYRQLLQDVADGNFDKPIRLRAAKGDAEWSN